MKSAVSERGVSKEERGLASDSIASRGGAPSTPGGRALGVPSAAGQGAPAPLTHDESPFESLEVRFGKNSSSGFDSSQLTILVTTLEPGSRYVVVGHASSEGADSANDALSKKRAEAICSAIRGRDASARIEMDWRGERELKIRPERSELARSWNRRVEVTAFRLLSVGVSKAEGRARKWQSAVDRLRACERRYGEQARGIPRDEDGGKVYLESYEQSMSCGARAAELQRRVDELRAAIVEAKQRGALVLPRYDGPLGPSSKEIWREISVDAETGLRNAKTKDEESFWQVVREELDSLLGESVGG